MTDVRTARAPHQQRPALAPAATATAAGSSAPSKRKQRAPRSLLLLLKSLVGLRVRVDLKTDATVEGVVAEVVHDMECVCCLSLTVFVFSECVVLTPIAAASRWSTRARQNQMYEDVDRDDVVLVVCAYDR